jgi:hypothetical protein
MLGKKRAVNPATSGAGSPDDIRDTGREGERMEQNRATEYMASAYV